MYTENTLDPWAQCSMDALKTAYFIPSFSSLIWANITFFVVFIILCNRIWMRCMHRIWKVDFESIPSRSDKQSNYQQQSSHTQRTLTTCSARGRQAPRIYHSQNINDRMKRHSQQLPITPKYLSGANVRAPRDRASFKNANTPSDSQRRPPILPLQRLLSISFPAGLDQMTPLTYRHKLQQRNMDSNGTGLCAILRQLCQEISKRNAKRRVCTE